MTQLRVLSLGAGVQSTTLALLAAHGDIEPPNVAVFADTQWEPRSVYDHLAWLREPGRLPFPIHVVSAGDIRDSISTRRNTTGGSYTAIPWHILKPSGATSIGRRQCSNEYKLEPIAREIRRLLGKGPHDYIPKGAVEVLLGISREEAHRMREAKQRYMQNCYPLIDLEMRRYDCLVWLKRHGYPEPPKSACIGCPYTDNARWRERRRDHPEEWAEAVAYDRLLRQGTSSLTEYMHRSLTPLDKADLDDGADRQLDLFAAECLGVCNT
jgi:hypothetical protein